MDTNLCILRQFIREQIGSSDLLGASQSVRTMDVDPHTFEDLPGYNVDVTSNVNGEYSVTIKHKGKKIAPLAVYRDYDEAYHHARMVIDKHRVGDMQKSG